MCVRSYRCGRQEEEACVTRQWNLRNGAHNNSERLAAACRSIAHSSIPAPHCWGLVG